MINPIEEMLKVCESSLDRRPEFLRAVANVHRYHNHASIEDAQLAAEHLRDQLQEMDNRGYQRNVALEIGEAAVFCDEAQSVLWCAIREMGE